MTLEGEFRDRYPRITLALPGSNSSREPVEVEFIVDTGFDGEIVLPGYLARQIDLRFEGTQKRMLANGALVECPVHSLLLSVNGDDEEEPRLVEVLVMEGNALLGTLFLDNHHLQVTVTEGGEVLIEPV